MPICRRSAYMSCSRMAEISSPSTVMRPESGLISPSASFRMSVFAGARFAQQHLGLAVVSRNEMPSSTGCSKAMETSSKRISSVARVGRLEVAVARLGAQGWTWLFSEDPHQELGDEDSR